jgi:thiol-disulfide isomerase/thioredoxin
VHSVIERHGSIPIRYYSTNTAKNGFKVKSAFDGRYLAKLYGGKSYALMDVFKKGQGSQMIDKHKDIDYRPLMKKAKKLAAFDLSPIDSQYVRLLERDSSNSPYVTTAIIGLEQLTVNRQTGLIEKAEDWAWFEGGVQYRSYELISIRPLDKSYKDSIKATARQQIAEFRTYASQDSLNEAYRKRFVLLKTGDTLPSFGGRFYGSNDSITLHPGMDSIFVFDFFYTTCGPCVAAIPELKKIDSLYRSKGVFVIGLDPMPQDWSRLPKFMDMLDIPYPVLQAPRPVSELFGVNAYPTLMVFQNGILRFVQVGYSEKLSEVLVKELDALLNR